MSCCKPGQSCGVAKADNVTENVKDYYGKVLQCTGDLKTNVCTLGSARVPQHVRDIMKLLHPDVTSKYYGCGVIVPESIDGCNVLDLGCGVGVDCYVLSRLVGQSGHVTGVDMTQEQLDVAVKYVDYHMKQFGYSAPNIDFVNSYIEKLTESGIQENHYDVIVSNCVINLCVDKRAVLEEAYRVLKVGGEMYFSDMYCDRRLSDETKQNKVLWGECIGGALYWRDLFTMASNVGFVIPRLLVASAVNINQPQLVDVIGDARFMAATFRLFKLAKSTQVAAQVVYKGTIPHNVDQYKFDSQYTFTTGVAVRVDGEVVAILKQSRFADAFLFTDSAPSDTTGVATCCETCVPDGLTWETMLSKTTSSGCCG